LVSRTGVNAIQAIADSTGTRETAPSQTLSGGEKVWPPLTLPGQHYSALSRGLSTAPFSQRVLTYQQDIPTSNGNAHPHLAGYLLYIPISAFFTGYRQYTTAPIAQDLAYLHGLSTPRYLAVEIITDIFFNSDQSAILPSYWYSPTDPNWNPQFQTAGSLSSPVQSEIGGVYTGSTTGQTPGVTRLMESNTALLAEYALLLNWLASPTGGNLNGHPALAWITANDESLPSDAGNIPNFQSIYGPYGYSNTSWTAGQVSLAQTMAAAWTKTVFSVEFNWIGVALADKVAFGNALVAAGAGFGGPDTLYQTTNTVGGVNYNGTDGVCYYTGQFPGSMKLLPPSPGQPSVLPGMWQVQTPDIYGGQFNGGNATPAQLFAWANGTVQQHFMAWARQSTSNAADWSTSVLPFIDANPLTNTAYPSGLPQ
jgi:hypothetical protein